ncbi:hypothetical protein HY484_03380 [Candidatus Woesearchaeota archaeon]|nr:hypothetical protein [Candidatus Woesearchaeota archaeon]
MSEVNDDKQLRQKIDGLQRSVTFLQSEADKIYASRNSLEKEQRSLRNELKKLIFASQEARKERDALTAEVKEEKTKRSELSAQIKEKIGSVKSLSTDAKIAGSLGRLKHEINVINTKIETEVISFEKEKALMKRLHVLEKEYAAAKKSAESIKERKEVSCELNVLKKSADDIHGGIQKKAELSQEKHELAVSASKKIDEIKRKLDELNKVILDKEKALGDINSKLEPLLKELGELSGKVRKTADEVYRRRQDSMKKTLQEKRTAIEARLKRGEKLTTEDLLVMQSGD